MLDTKRVAVNDTTPTLLAKGPCRCFLQPDPTVASPSIVIGEQSITQSSGFGYNYQELHLGTGERVFGLAYTLQGGPASFDVKVLTYGVP